MTCLYVVAMYLIFAVHDVDPSIVSDIRAVSMTAKDTAGLIANNAEAMQDERTSALGWFATGSKDHTITLWSLFADS